MGRRDILEKRHHHNLGPLADEFGSLRAQIAELKVRERHLREQILASGEEHIEGDIFRVFTRHSTRKTLDIEAVREELGPQWVSKHSKETEMTILRAIVRPQAESQ